MDAKKWLKLQEQEVKARRDNPLTYWEDGVEYDIELSQKFGDEWFFKLVNGDWDNIVPGLCTKSAVYSMAVNCIINLILNGMDEDDIAELVKNSAKIARDIENDE
jgi:hypothetical protein